MRWNAWQKWKLHEALCGRIRHDNRRASWEVLMLTIAIRTWITVTSSGDVALLSYSEGVSCDFEKLRAKSPEVNILAK